MCGIAGIVDLRGRREFSEAVVRRMNRVQAHRGPDQEGVHVEPGVALGHQRLSIIDLSGGRQPLANEDGSVIVVYNGEIYNFQPLMEELIRAGHRFATRSDTEVIVHAWEQWGEDCVSRFRGMFAFALWDRRQECLFLARDRLGVKPLFYAALGDGTFVFGSELKALTAYSGVTRQIDPLAIEEYLALGYVAEPRTIYKGIRKLEPGALLVARRNAAVPEPRRYWDVRFTRGATLTLEDAEQELKSRLKESIELRMIAEVPLGAFLSGGVDSSAVVATMAEVSATPVRTCSIAFDDPAFDETNYAAMVATRYATDHFVKTVAADDFDLVDKLAAIYDEPYADSSAIPTYRVCELARQRVTVALSGDGGDEVFGGYRRYRMHLMEGRMRGLLPLALRKPLFGALGTLYPKADWAPRVFRAKTTFQALARDSVEAYFTTMSLLGDSLRQSLFSPAFKKQLGGYSAFEVFKRHAAAADTDDGLSLVQYLDIKTYLVGDINTKVDRASMAHSLEVREPLMDHPLVEWMATLPRSLKVRGNEGKYLLKRTMRGALPPEVLYRPKMGFAVPLARWFRGPLAERVRSAMREGPLVSTGWFEPALLNHLVSAHQSGARDYSAPLWSLMMLEAFLRNAGLAETNSARAA